MCPTHPCIEQIVDSIDLCSNNCTFRLIQFDSVIMYTTDTQIPIFSINEIKKICRIEFWVLKLRLNHNQRDPIPLFNSPVFLPKSHLPLSYSMFHCRISVCLVRSKRKSWIIFNNLFESRSLIRSNLVGDSPSPHVNINHLWIMWSIESLHFSDTNSINRSKV